MQNIPNNFPQKMNQPHKVIFGESILKNIHTPNAVVRVLGVPLESENISSKISDSNNSLQNPDKTGNYRENFSDNSKNTQKVSENITKISEILDISPEEKEFLQKNADNFSEHYFQDFPNLFPQWKAMIDGIAFYFPPQFDEKKIFFVEKN